MCSKSSLDILLDDVPQASYHTYTHSDTSASAQLETYCQHFVSLTNSRPLDNHLVENEPSDPFIALIDNLPVASTLEEHFQNLATVAEAYPDVQVDIVHISCGLDDQTKGRASAFVMLEIRGYPKPLVRQVMAVLQFRRRGCGWQYFQYIGMRGQML